MSDLIRIIKPKDAGRGDGAGPSGGAAGASGSGSGKGKEAADPVADEPGQRQKRPGQVEWCAAATEVESQRNRAWPSCVRQPFHLPCHSIFQPTLAHASACGAWL